MSDPGRRYSWEDYLYPAPPGELPVLRNLRGTRDFAQAQIEERILTAGRAEELHRNPEFVERTFEVTHWKALHRQLFQDVWGWAGQFRTVDIAKGSSGFTRHGHLDEHAELLLGQVREQRMFAGQKRAQAGRNLAITYQGMNSLHPFREGNGRVQRLLLSHIAEAGGLLIDWQRISPDEQNHAAAASFAGNLQPLIAALEKAVIPVARGGSTPAATTPVATAALHALPRRSKDLGTPARPPSGPPARRHDPPAARGR